LFHKKSKFSISMPKIKMPGKRQKSNHPRSMIGGTIQPGVTSATAAVAARESEDPNDEVPERQIEMSELKAWNMSDFEIGSPQINKRFEPATAGPSTAAASSAATNKSPIVPIDDDEDETQESAAAAISSVPPQISSSAPAVPPSVAALTPETRPSSSSASSPPPVRISARSGVGASIEMATMSSASGAGGDGGTLVKQLNSDEVLTATVETRSNRNESAGAVDIANLEIDDDDEESHEPMAFKEAQYSDDD
jgi:hypothetical protein